jgi:hypothetical protein
MGEVRCRDRSYPKTVGGAEMEYLDRIRVKIVSQDEKVVEGKMWIDKRIHLPFVINAKGKPCQMQGCEMTTESMALHAMYLEVYVDMCFTVESLGLTEGVKTIKWIYGGGK